MVGKKTKSGGFLMETYIVRAFQVIDLMENELNKVHQIENKNGYYMTNFNIQNLFSKKCLKEVFNLPNSDELEMNLHATKIKNLIDNNKLNLVDIQNENGVFKKYLSPSNIDELHAYDWNIKRNFNHIDFQYVGKIGSRSGKLKELLRGDNYE